MKVKAKDTIAGYYGTKTAGQEFEIRSGEGHALAAAGLVEIISEDDAPEDAPKSGGDMLKVRKANKPAANRETKEEKNTGDNK